MHVCTLVHILQYCVYVTCNGYLCLRVYVNADVHTYIYSHVSVYASCVYMHSRTYVQYLIDNIM